METSEPGAIRDTGMPTRRNTTPSIGQQRCKPIMPPLSVDPGLIPHSWDSDDDGGRSQPTTQCHHGHPYDIGERVDVLVPDPFQELFGADDGAVRAQELLQHPELLARQPDIAAVAEHLTAGRIEGDPGTLQPGRRC